MNTINLFHFNDHSRGPGKVVSNLQKGLAELGKTVNNNPSSISEDDGNGVLQLTPSVLKLPETSLFGPNLVVTPDEARQLFESDRKFVVPSQWVKDLYSQFDFINPDNLYIWAVGIDTVEWRDKVVSRSVARIKPKYDCLLYTKNRSKQDIQLVKAILKKFNLNYIELSYGSYKEIELKNACFDSKFAVLVTGTESQGIAYMQILSSNLPCFVFNASKWHSESGKHHCEATSVPYFDETCGETTLDIDLNLFDQFIKNVDNDVYTPRRYILKSHSLIESAIQYVDLLEKAKQ